MATQVASFSAQIKFDTTACETRLKSALEFAQNVLDKQIIVSMTPYVPKDTGELMGSVKGAGTGLISYNTVYARKLYYGANFNFQKTYHPQASAAWFERAKEQDSKKWIDNTQRAADNYLAKNPSNAA